MAIGRSSFQIVISRVMIMNKIRMFIWEESKSKIVSSKSSMKSVFRKITSKL